MATRRNTNSDFIHSVYSNVTCSDDGLNAAEIEALNNKRRAALAKIDDAEFSWLHFRACVVSGIGFFTDAYNLFVIDLVSTMVGYVYGGWSRNLDLGLKIACTIGTCLGMVIFGHMADRYGRKNMYGIDIVIILAATICSTLVGNSRAVSIYGSLIFWRIILGLGTGGDYPLTAIITSEFASAANRGAMMASVFAMQGFGILAAAIVSLVVVRCFKDEIIKDPETIDYVWRLVLGWAAIPCIIALYFRLTIPETPHYSIEIERTVCNTITKSEWSLQGKPVREVDAIFQKWRDSSHVTIKGFIEYFRVWNNGKILLAMSLTWFCVDICFYGLAMNHTFILNEINLKVPTPENKLSPTEMYKSLYDAAVGTIIVTAIGTVPGYWVSVFLVDRIGRKPIMWLGFTMSGILLIILGVWYSNIINNRALFIALYVLTMFFQNFGPNAITFIISGEVFTTRYRSTAYGISAGVGKLGAVVAQLAFTYAYNAYISEDKRGEFFGPLLALSSIFMAIGIGFTFLLPETKGRPLEDLSKHPSKMELTNGGTVI